MVFAADIVAVVFQQVLNMTITLTQAKTALGASESFPDLSLH